MRNNEFGGLLRTARLGRQLGVRQFSKMIFVSPSMVAHLEFGRSKPPARLVSLICTALKLNRDQRKMWMLIAARAHGFEVY